MASSKQPKQPAFPHPVLETGVPSYPTPNVPDFYTKSGHIILQEKVSVEKGNYTPLPLDGSVVYSGRDASKWPSPLYLVAERPTADGEYSIRYWANDRTYASQDPWNYNLSYSGDNPSYPIYTRLYIVRRDQYTPVAIGTVDPIIGGTAVVTKQEMQELSDDNPMRSLHVAVQVTYESVPGPLLGGYENKPGLLGTTTINDQIVAPDTAPDTLSMNVLSSSVEKVSSTKSKKTTVYSTSPMSLSGGENKGGLLGTVQVQQSIVSAGSNPDALSYTTLVGGGISAVVSSAIDPIDASKSKKTTMVSTGPQSLVGSRVSSRGDVETITESIVPTGTAANSDSYLLASSEVKPIDQSKSQKTNSAVTGYVQLSAAGFNIGGVSSSGAKTVITSNIVNPSDYTRPTLGVNDISYTEKALSPTKIEVVRETLDDTLGYPKIYSSGIDHVSYTGYYKQYQKVILNSDTLTALATGGVISEYEGIDKLHARITHRDYSNLIGYQWIETETESYTYPSILNVYNQDWASAWSFSNIKNFFESKTVNVRANVHYKITDTDDGVQPTYFSQRTLVTDLGTYQNVLHNVLTYKFNNAVVSTVPTEPAPGIGTWFRENIISRVSYTRINGMGGLFLQKVVSVPNTEIIYLGGFVQTPRNYY